MQLKPSGHRIQKARSVIAPKLILMDINIAVRKSLIKNYDDLSFKTFIRGLSGRNQNMVRLRNSNCLEHALEEKNSMLNQKQMSFITHPKFKINLSLKKFSLANHSVLNSFSNAQNIIPQQKQCLSSPPRQNMP